MSRRGTVELQFADGTHLFRLRIGELIELQEKCDAGPAHILMRLSSQAWHVNDVKETLRLGLIGGGKTAAQAHALIQRYVVGPTDDPVPLAPLVLTAELVLSAALYGVEDENAPKSDPATDEIPSSEESSDGETGTAPAPPSA